MTENDTLTVLLKDFIWTLFIVVKSVFRACLASIFGLFAFLPRHYKDISEDIVLVTGGGRGIGRLIAVELAKYKPKMIILWGRHEETLMATSGVIQMMGVTCHTMTCDVADYEDVYKKASEIKDKYGDVTMCINNAGVVFGNTVLESESEEILYTLKVNAAAHFWTTKAFLPAMLKNNHGHLVFINSMLGIMGLAGAADYCCSKFGSAGFVESLKLEIANEKKDDVHVTIIHPYLVDTGMFSGCQTRFPALFPELHAEYVAWKTVDAVLTNSYMVLLPRLMYFMSFITKFLPIDAIIAIHRFTGVDICMESFHGRKKKKKQK